MLQVKLLSDVGIAAIHIADGCSMYDTVSSGDYRFGSCLYVKCPERIMHVTLPI